MLRGEIYLLQSSSLFVMFLELTPLFRFVRLIKDERPSLGLQPGSGTGVALERPGTFSKRSWQPMSLTSNVPEDKRRQDTLILDWPASFKLLPVWSGYFFTLLIRKLQLQIYCGALQSTPKTGLMGWACLALCFDTRLIQVQEVWNFILKIWHPRRREGEWAQI